ncbi:TPA: MBL fold metallo-hydrolase [Candidatus Micrarchaeota archaeon]|nr:MBL fold metallo-hydrolase [Candidatus Micrarchaeota archaeon]
MTGLKWKIGQVEISQITEIDAGDVIQGAIKEATPENIKAIKWLYPHFADEHGKLKSLVQSFLIKSNGKNILIDTCNGNDKIRSDLPQWGKLHTDFLKKLNAISADAKDIDIVICTHFHCDHVGWNTKLENGIWKPTFMNAKYIFPREEYDYWKQMPEKELEDDKHAFNDSVAPIIKSGLAEFVDPDHKIDNRVKLIPTPGHTPDHVSIMIESDGQNAMISGDFLHHPCQIASPNWSMPYDSLPDKALDTRRKILSQIADANILLIGSHFPNPVAGHVRRSKEGFVFEI